MYNPYGLYPQNNMRTPVYPQIVQQPMAPQEQVAQPVQSGVKVIPVASITEAQAVPTDFMGDTLLLTDFAHGCIYTKVLNPNTGSAIFRTFRLTEDVPQPMAAEYDAKTEIDKLKAELVAIRRELGIEEAANV